MIRSTEDFRCLLKAARRAGTPLLVIRTADPASAMTQASVSLCGKDEVPVFAWDIMAGSAPPLLVRQMHCSRFKKALR